MWSRIRDLTSSSGGYELLPADGPADAYELRPRPAPAHAHALPPRAFAPPSPSATQAATLRRVPGAVPVSSYALALVELAERASYYGVGGVFANFVQRPLPPGSTSGAPVPGGKENQNPGALGMGIRVATGLSTLFTLMAYTTPLAGGALADLRWGKFRTIAVGTGVAGLAHMLSVYAALPSLLVAGTAFGPFIVSLILLGASAGLIKANIAPLMAEQYVLPDHVETLRSGEKVIVEREATIQKIMGAYYHSINIGAFIAISSTFAEKYVGFWLAFLIPGFIFFLMPLLLYGLHPYLEPEAAPSSTALIDGYKFVRAAMRDRQSKEPSPQPVQEIELASPCDAEPALPLPGAHVSQAVTVVKLFLFFTIYNVADGGLNTLMTSMAGSMTTNGVPNDLLEKTNPFAIVVSIPILDRVVYPYLSRRRIRFGPIRRIVTGFVLAAAAMVWCALLQHMVYRTSPCGSEATTCDRVSPLSAWLVLPAPLLTGVSESIAVVSAMELGYTMSPPGLKSVVTSLFLFMQATGAALVLVFLPLMHDPALVWPFALTAILTLGAAVAVWKTFRHLDNT